MANAAAITEKLKELYPEALCALKYNGEPWRLLVMARLSAQCTDERVNAVCTHLFERFPTVQSLAYAPSEQVEGLIYSCGLYKVKARDITAACRILVEEYGGKLPSEMDVLLSLPGVGRKIANLLRGEIYGVPAIVAETHCMRISRRMGLVPADRKTPEAVEKILSEKIAENEQSDFCHRIVLLGREYCPARGYDCKTCPMNALCDKVVF